MMMSSENRIGRWTSSAAARTVADEALGASSPSRRRATSCMMRSTITMVASTMMPKSMAPMLSRLSETPTAAHADEGEQQRQRDDQGGRERCSNAEQEDEQHRHDDHEPFESKTRDTVRSVFRDERRPVVDRHDADARRQAAAVDLVDRVVQGVEHLAGILPAAHQHDAFHPADPVGWSLMAKIPVCGTGADPNPTDVAHEERHAFRRIEHDLLDVVDRLDEAGAADRQRPADPRRAARRRRYGCCSFTVVGDAGATLSRYLSRARRIDLDLVLTRPARRRSRRRRRRAPGAAAASGPSPGSRAAASHRSLPSSV